jgi:hypothetical protein
MKTFNQQTLGVRQTWVVTGVVLAVLASTVVSQAALANCSAGLTDVQQYANEQDLPLTVAAEPGCSNGSKPEVWTAFANEQQELGALTPSQVIALTDICKKSKGQLELNVTISGPAAAICWYSGLATH